MGRLWGGGGGGGGMSSVLSHKGGHAHLNADAAIHIHKLCHAVTITIIPDYRLIAVHSAIFYIGIVHIDL